MQRTKWLVVATVMLFSIAALWSSGSSASANSPVVVASDFCSECESQCFWDAYSGLDGYYWQCKADPTNTDAYCSMKATQRYNNCVTVLCNYAGCSIPPKTGRLCRDSGICV